MRLFIAFVILLSFGCKGERATSWQPQIKSNTFLQLPLPAPSPSRTGSGAPGSSYWQQQVDHTIKAALDVETNSIIASQIVKYKNNSPDTLTYIWLQLEQNIHRGDSVRSREGRGTGEDSYVGITITELKVDGKDATLHDYGTLAKVVLDKPLLPNKSVIQRKFDTAKYSSLMAQQHTSPCLFSTNFQPTTSMPRNRLFITSTALGT